MKTNDPNPHRPPSWRHERAGNRHQARAQARLAEPKAGSARVRRLARIIAREVAP